MAWKNPDTNASVTYDGVQARIIASVTSGDRANLATTPPKVSAVWEVRATPNHTNRFDIRPVTPYDSTTGARDTAKDDIVNVTPEGTEQCTEYWMLSPSAIACVKLQGTVKRPRNTGDTLDDIILEYGKYAIHAMIGDTGETNVNSD